MQWSSYPTYYIFLEINSELATTTEFKAHFQVIIGFWLLRQLARKVSRYLAYFAELFSEGHY
jgi:hypothetical protein